MSTIEDGVGTGVQAKVGEQNRVHTHALTASDVVVAGVNGDAFDVNSGLVTLTSANESGIVYVKNNEDRDIGIVTEFSNIGSSTGGSGNGVLKFHLNPTGGTLISAASVANSFNRRMGDASELDGDQFKGVEGSTITGGSSIDIPVSGSGLYNSIFIVPKGQSFALSWQPPASNTSQTVQLGLLVVKNYERYTVE